MLGFVAGGVAFWLLVLPAIKQDVYRQANEQIIQYSESLSSQGVELSKAQDEAQESGNSAEAAAKQIQEEQTRSQSYEALFNAYSYMQQDELDSAALEIQKVDESVLSDSAKGVYSTICQKTGVSGKNSSGSGTTDGSEGDGSTDSGDGSSEYDENE